MIDDIAEKIEFTKEEKTRLEALKEDVKRGERHEYLLDKPSTKAAIFTKFLISTGRLNEDQVEPIKHKNIIDEIDKFLREKAVIKEEKSVTDERLNKYKDRMKKIHNEFVKKIKRDKRTRVDKYKVISGDNRTMAADYSLEIFFEDGELDISYTKGGPDDGLLLISYKKVYYTDSNDVERFVNDQIFINKDGTFLINKCNLDEETIEQHQITQKSEEAITNEKTSFAIDDIGKILEVYSTSVV
ncbi:MAG: hypothetical protein M1268_01270 [Patescibacteria group bacterium]|nr:hypothetical protein [Patescibacteria group bacterium]